jgi:hypothetical protein
MLEHRIACETAGLMSSGARPPVSKGLARLRVWLIPRPRSLTLLEIAPLLANPPLFSRSTLTQIPPCNFDSQLFPVRMIHK